jgi:hypothetical protein
MRRFTTRVDGLAAAVVGLALGGCFTGPAPDVTGPALSLSTTSLSFAAPAGGADPAPQTITASDGGGGDAGTLLAPTAQITYRNGSGWLGATVSGTAAPYTITVQASIGALGPGMYLATIDVDSPGASSSPQSVSVSLTVGSSSQPTMTLSPTALSFESVGGMTPPAQTVTVSNAGVGTLAPPVPTTTYLGQEKSWLAVTVSDSAAPYTITVQPIVTGLPPRPSPNLASISVDCPGASNTPLAVAVQLTVR